MPDHPSRLRLLIRLLLFVVHMAAGMGRAIYCRLLYGREWFCHHKGRETVRRWCNGLTRILGIHVTVHGIASTKAAMFVSNHISWLDIIALNSHHPITFVSKDDVRSWPVIGTLTALAGTIFLQRGSITILHRNIDAVAQRIHQGQSVGFFPEGTTTNGETILNFHPALFEAAIKKGGTIQPVAIRYLNTNGAPDRDIAYIDDESFVANLLRIMRRPSSHVVLSYLSPVSSHNSQRRQLAQKCRHAIATHLQEEIPRQKIA